MYLGNYGLINTNYIDSIFSLTNSEINTINSTNRTTLYLGDRDISSDISLIYVSGLTLSSSICSSIYIYSNNINGSIIFNKHNNII